MVSIAQIPVFSFWESTLAEPWAKDSQENKGSVAKVIGNMMLKIFSKTLEAVERCVPHSNLAIACPPTGRSYRLATRMPLVSNPSAFMFSNGAGEFLSTTLTHELW